MHKSGVRSMKRKCEAYKAMYKSEAWEAVPKNGEWSMEH